MDGHPEEKGRGTLTDPGVPPIARTTVPDRREVSARLDELSLLEDGWLDGEGFAPSADGLNWLGTAFGQHYPGNLPSPRIYPAPEGTLIFEWDHGAEHPSLEIDLGARTGYWHVLGLAGAEGREALLNLDEVGGWAALGERFDELKGGAAG